ncbi:type II restriction endonuclease [Campylobacter hepaticus]|uniref:Type II restriction endonuclease n=1 Tax=Campylobacter hepaticus TaxID=1813019 RepID=A0A6A7JS74_9BACT|nr:DpnII family type II restriction endonuclease [Campylobacter hepaticus]AXP09343.1 type II restriction endonuclease [Campylobacter hepaticus]MCZ0772913.1 type II restriction endonuclease [Campylobacter hepaticus]MCZ0774382.1 type II restriction endonuclease [Campylobacter hepaticus]MCZ0775634.1 type II restriction endonuclease [Campylobacter hepaticus]MDX2323581.1 DpnII family type II restriction endonuclease [Campylobacter hepaticus]
MKNKLTFNGFIDKPQPTNTYLGFYIDWEKCLKNKDKIEMALNYLNLLLKAKKKQLQRKIKTLFKEYPKVFNILPLLITIKNAANNKLFNSQGQICVMSSCLKTPYKIYKFIHQSKLSKIFYNEKIKNLNDFAFGIEMELNTNARKNYRGDNFEKENQFINN